MAKIPFIPCVWAIMKIMRETEKEREKEDERDREIRSNDSRVKHFCDEDKLEFNEDQTRNIFGTTDTWPWITKIRSSTLS